MTTDTSRPTTSLVQDEDAYEYTRAELELAFRNRAMPLEALAHDITPDTLHYTLIHWDVPQIDPTTWRLEIGGAVEQPLEVSLDDLRRRPRVSMPVTLECAGNGRGLLPARPNSLAWLGNAVGTSEWTGTPLGPILDEAGLDPSALEVVFTGADHGLQGEVHHAYARSLSVAEACREEVLLADAMNGRPLPPDHGAPLRLVVPGWYGCASVKWLTSISAVTQPFTGYQQRVAFRYQSDEDDPGTPVSRARVRALMVPPGHADAFTRRRFLEPGPVRLHGRAWSGSGRVVRVEVSAAGDTGAGQRQEGQEGQEGHGWVEAQLDPPVGEHAWRGWHHDWDATPGRHVLRCRATDETGATQPLDPPWNLQGMGNNAVQRVEVTVT